MVPAAQARILLVVAAGGVIGSLARFGVAEAMGHGQATALLATLTVNLVGALAIGVAYPWIRSASGSPLWQPFVVTGMLGGFTTFSTFAGDVVLNRDAPVLVLGYVACTLVIGLLAVPAGRALFGLLRPAP